MDSLPPAAGHFVRESSSLTDRLSGRPIVQLTSAASISHHIYPEAQVFTPDGSRTLFWRVRPSGGSDIFLADLLHRSIRPLTDEALHGQGTCIGPTIHPEGEWLYYILSSPTTNEMRRANMTTFERQRLWEIPPGGLYVLGTISPDGRWYVTGLRPPEGKPQVIRIDLETGDTQPIYASDAVFNPHPVWDPSGSGWLLVQENTGYQLSPHGTRLVDGLGARLLVMDQDGQNVRQLDLGRREHEWIQGHQTWLGRRGEVVATAVHRRPGGGQWRSDAVYALAPDGGRRTVVAGHSFCHIGADASGRWIVCDTTRSGHIYLIDSDRGHGHFVCASASSFGAAQYSHPHPALSPDARWIVFNSDRTGISQLYAVEISELTKE